VAYVYVARHGETTWNAQGRYQGRQESQLSELGVRQAYALAQALVGRGVKRIISSPLMRCAATAAPCAQRLGIPIELDERLIEIAHGTWEGRYRDEIERDDAARYRSWREDPALLTFDGGESVVNVLKRWRSFAADFLATEDALIMTHDVVVRMALIQSAGGELQTFWQRRVANCAFAVFDVRGHRWLLEQECVSQHMSGIAADASRQAL